MSKSTIVKVKGKAVKPYPEFPLTPHPTGRWCKKIRGKLHYFGPLADHEAALTKWEAERDYLLTGRTPPANPDGVTVADVIDAFLVFKEERVTTGELSHGMWSEYKRATDAIAATFGLNRLASDLDASDFGRLREYLSKGRGLVAMGALIRKCKIAFKWGFDSGMLDRPPRYGQSFQMPGRASLRKERVAKGRLDFTAEEVRTMLENATSPMKAFILLAVNCGYGSGDIGQMPAAVLQLTNGWTTYPRPKTGIARRCWLWPETIKECKTAMINRPDPKSDEFKGLAFLTIAGQAYNRWRGKSCHIDAVAQQFTNLCERVGIEQAGRGFYSLRRTFATVADAARDPVAVRYILGHAAPASDMGDVYRQNIEDDRLKIVAQSVRKWLYTKPKASKPKRKAARLPR